VFLLENEREQCNGEILRERDERRLERQRERERDRERAEEEVLDKVEALEVEASTYLDKVVHAQQQVRGLGNTLQHSATHCNTLQHTATRCNPLYIYVYIYIHIYIYVYTCIYVYIYIYARCVSHKEQTFVVYHKVTGFFACGFREFSKSLTEMLVG